MTVLVPGWPDDDLRRAAFDALRRAYIATPELEVDERPGWLRLTAPSFREGGLNGVWQSVLADDEADAVIDATLAHFRGHGVRLRWIVDPDSRPLDLADRLAGRGLTGEPCRIMARATTGAVEAPSADADVTIERVDHASVEEYSRVTAAGWSLDPAPFAAYHRLVLDDPDGKGALYLARWRGEAAATAAHMRVGPAICLMGGVVLPGHRGRGLYRALVDARLRDAAGAGVPLAATLARAGTSAPILERLGFVTICEATAFRGA